MSKNIIIKKAGKKGKGFFATRNFKKGEVVIHKDISRLKRYSLKEISENPNLQKVSDHCDYIGYGKYVIDFSPVSYINHSCDPNAYADFEGLTKAKVIALKAIKKGEEITVDYGIIAPEQIKGAYPKTWVHLWKVKCYCGSQNCRKIIYGDFFRLPKAIQLEKLLYLPTWIKKKYSKRLKF